MSLPIGTLVRVKPPFAETFPGEYTTVDPPPLADGDDPYARSLNWLDGVTGAFADKFLDPI